MAFRSRLIAVVFLYCIVFFSIFLKFLFFCFCFNVAHIFVDVTVFQGNIVGWCPILVLC